LKRIQARLAYDQRLSLFWSVLHLGHACWSIQGRARIIEEGRNYFSPLLGRGNLPDMATERDSCSPGNQAQTLFILLLVLSMAFGCALLSFVS
jgi:hypothetical protein